MSASREKRKRQELYESGEIVRKAPKKNDGGLPGWANWLIGIGAIVILVVFLAFIITTSNPFLNSVTAVRVGDTKFSSGEANYYYWDAVNTTANYYGDYFQYFVDTSKSFSSQNYSEDMSWADYFMQSAENSMQQITILYNEAVKNGLTLTDEQKQAIDDTWASLESQAAEYGWTSTEGYLKAFYGKASSEESYRNYLEKQALASAYYTQLVNSYEYSDEEISAYYAEHKNDFDSVSFRLLSVSSSADGMTADEAKNEADRIATAANNHEALFIEEAKALYLASLEEDSTDEDYDADSATLHEDVSYSYTGTNYADWLFDESRTSGETTVIEISNSDGTTTFAVLYFIERDAKDYPLVNVRHILISAEDSSDADSMAAAKSEAEELLAQWEAGEATEDSFAALANEKSADTGSNTNGGLYENVYQGQMVDAFNDWCFDADRQIGDTGIVESSYGYHIMYFSGLSETTYQELAVDSTLRGTTYNEWYAEMQEQNPINEKAFGTLFVNK